MITSDRGNLNVLTNLLNKNLESSGRYHFIHMACTHWMFRSDGFTFSKFVPLWCHKSKLVYARFWDSNVAMYDLLSGNTKSAVIYTVWSGIFWKSWPLVIYWSYITLRIPRSSPIFTFGAFRNPEPKSLPRSSKLQARFLLPCSCSSFLSNFYLIGFSFALFPSLLSRFSTFFSERLRLFSEFFCVF